MNNYLIWILVALIFGLTEMYSMSMVGIWFVFGSIIALVASLFGVSIIDCGIIALVFSIVSLVVLRPIFVKHTKTKKHIDKCSENQSKD